MELRERATEYLASNGISEPLIKEPREDLERQGIQTTSGPIGIPQGSFVSCILANVILAEADAQCEKVRHSSVAPRDGLYLRFCDDVFISHREEDACRDMLNAYLDAISGLPCGWPFMSQMGARYIVAQECDRLGGGT